VVTLFIARDSGKVITKQAEAGKGFLDEEKTAEADHPVDAQLPMASIWRNIKQIGRLGACL